MKLRTLAVGLMVGALALTACGREGSPTTPAAPGGETAPEVSYPVATGVSLPDSPTFAKIQQRGRIVAGVRDDQPGLGFRDATTGEYAGFDVEIARMIAAGLGYGEDQIDYVVVPSAAREDTIERGDIDYMVGTYTINDTRKQRVSFAGPYYVAGQSVLVAADNTTITGKDTLQGQRVCSVTGSTPIQRVRDQGLTDQIVEFQTYSQCVDQLLAGQVDAVTTDDAILAGFASQRPDELKVVGEPFSQEPYGIGLNRDDSALRNKINDILQASYDDGTWQKAYDSTLGLSGTTASPPELQRY
ncbi:glutamate transport system substrate-binding protein [Pseudonocardia hierapolitana]|uniref:Glutamate transport system substrate-binding protein n=1 Tax=Pseudonocardia hierapolitana TaxID=1128676 RepID=A0A561SHL7_9PSEU|nr:glutamate ABC transporter substrate-binding protein [Pseudonocardia hierapolitana]TWF74355.1 glutamate transport system substrate-binding protein [Pseudonocardia hierapolitana]